MVIRRGVSGSKEVINRFYFWFEKGLVVVFFLVRGCTERGFDISMVILVSVLFGLLLPLDITHQG